MSPDIFQWEIAPTTDVVHGQVPMNDKPSTKFSGFKHTSCVFGIHFVPEVGQQSSCVVTHSHDRMIIKWDYATKCALCRPRVSWWACAAHECMPCVRVRVLVWCVHMLLLVLLHELRPRNLRRHGGLCACARQV